MKGSHSAYIFENQINNTAAVETKETDSIRMAFCVDEEGIINLGCSILPHTQVGAVANMSALLMKQMLEGAEQQGATLAFDTSHVEDQGKRQRKW